ncbi:MAG TPA: hypothetical protein VFP19_10370 [Candidatus Limnocylindrales bacterium]|nr:hypothetical protein [Candidatus Limnocylindrales bacterium]
MPAVAAAAAARGAACEVVGAVRPDVAGDRVLQRLASAGVGHAAVNRTVAAELEPADLELALRYLPDARVIVLVDQDDLAEVAASAARWSGAALIRITSRESASSAGRRSGDKAAAGAGENDLVLESPPRDPDGAFAGLVGALAARLEAGEALASAWPATLAAVGADAVGRDAVARSAVSAPSSEAPAGPAGSDRPAAARSARPGSDRRSGRR